VVGVDAVERALVEFDAAGRAGEGDPQLLVERRDRGNFARVVEADLVEAAGPEEAP